MHQLIDVLVSQLKSLCFLKTKKDNGLSPYPSLLSFILVLSLKTFLMTPGLNGHLLHNDRTAKNIFVH